MVTPIKAKAIGSNTQSVEDLITKVKDRINQIQQLEKEQSAYLSADDQADLDKMVALLNGSEAVLEQYLKTGGILPNSTTPTGDGNTANSENLQVGWNGPADFMDDPKKVYDKIIQPYNTSSSGTNGLVFKMDDNMKSIQGKNVGNDIEFTITYKDGHVEKNLALGLATSKTPVAIMADQTTQGVTVDMSQVKRVGNLATNKADIIIQGGIGNDILIGSQGTDTISGNAGDDKIYGLGGFDLLEGGAGKDTITGGSGHATITGGDGFDTTYADKNDKVTDEELPNIIATEALDIGNFDSPDSVWVAEVVNNALSISKDPNATTSGTIDLAVPDGYMVYGKEDGKNLILVYQKLNDDGLPSDKQQIVRVNGVLDPSSHAAIRITSKSKPNHPTVIDLGGVKSQFNQIIMQKGQGSDVLIAPESALQGMKLQPSDIFSPSFGPKETETINTLMEDGKKKHWATTNNGDVTKAFPGWAKPPVVGAGTITLTPGDNQEILELDGDVTGYTYMGSLQKEDTGGKGTTVTLFLQKEGSKETKRLVFHIDKNNGNPKTIKVNGFEVQNAAAAVQMLGYSDTDSGGIFVGSPYGTDTSKAGKNKIIDQ